jgi:large subunit ribosomal protein L31
MKKGIHSEYKEATIVCSTCGTTYQTLSTESSLSTEICSNCHPFFTGQQRLVDTSGRVERFRKRFNLQEAED